MPMFTLIEQWVNYKLTGTGIYIVSDSLPKKYLLITKGKREVSVVKINPVLHLQIFWVIVQNHVFVCICVRVCVQASQVALVVKNQLANSGDIRDAGSTPESSRLGMVTHSSILTWRSPWTEEPGGLPSIGFSHRVGHNWSNLACIHIYVCVCYIYILCMCVLYF